jgi:hypothetical protein
MLSHPLGVDIDYAPNDSRGQPFGPPMNFLAVEIAP